MTAVYPISSYAFKIIMPKVIPPISMNPVATNGEIICAIDWILVVMPLTTPCLSSSTALVILLCIKAVSYTHLTLPTILLV